MIITCAVTGGADTAGRYESVPVTPEEIAVSAVGAAEAGAAIVHIHVRDPTTGKQSLDPVLYREVVERIRESGCEVVINLTTGAGARFVPGDSEPNSVDPSSNLRLPEERACHVRMLEPELCSLDLGSLNFGDGALVNVPRQIEVIAAVIAEAGVKPELEIFDTGHLALALDMIGRRLVTATPLFQIVMGVRWGAPANAETLVAMKSMLPPRAVWSAFGVSKFQFPMVALAVVAGGHVRVGLEDNLYLAPGELAPDNASLVRKARAIVEVLGESVATPDDARNILGLPTLAAR